MGGAVIERDILNQDIGRFGQTVVVVPYRLVGARLTRVQCVAIVVPGGHGIVGIGKFVNTHVVAFDTPDIVELELQFLVCARHQVIQTFLGLEVVGAVLCLEFLVEKVIAARGDSSRHTNEEGGCHYMIEFFHD